MIAAPLYVYRSATEGSSGATAAVATAVAATATTATTVTTVTAAVATTAVATWSTATCGQAVNAGACGIRLTTGVTAAASRLVAPRGKLIRHQGVDVARQFVAIATRATLTTGRALARRAVVAPVVEPAFWARAVVAVAVKTRCVAAVLAFTAKFTAAFVAAVTSAFIASITTPAALGAATP